MYTYVYIKWDIGLIFSACELMFNAKNNNNGKRKRGNIDVKVLARRITTNDEYKYSYISWRYANYMKDDVLLFEKCIFLM